MCGKLCENRFKRSVTIMVTHTTHKQTFLPLCLSTVIGYRLLCLIIQSGHHNIALIWSHVPTVNAESLWSTQYTEQHRMRRST